MAATNERLSGGIETASGQQIKLELCKRKDSSTGKESYVLALRANEFVYLDKWDTEELIKDLQGGLELIDNKL